MIPSKRKVPIPHDQEAYKSRHRVENLFARIKDLTRLTQVSHPCTNGQVERMSRTLKDATVKRYHHDGHEQLRAHLQLFVDAYNHARRLKTLPGLTPAH